MSNNEMNEFKDEILKKIREMESKFFNELSKKNFAININYDNFNDKVNSILDSNKSMISSITTRKLNIDKIDKLELDIQKIGETLITHDIRINNTLNEIKKMKFNYDKIISENLIIPAYIGPGCEYKSLGEFIIIATEEFKKYKEEKDNLIQIKSDLNNRFDSFTKNMTNFIELNTSRNRTYTDSKEREYQIMIESKLQKLDEKTLETNKHIYSNQIKFEEQLKEIGDKLGRLTTNNNNNNNYNYNYNKIDINSTINGKLAEIKRKEDEMDVQLQKAIKEVNELKKIKQELTDQMKSIYLKMEDLNKNSKLKNIQQSKINKDLMDMINKRNNANSVVNIFNNKNNNNNNSKINTNNITHKSIKSNNNYIIELNTEKNNEKNNDNKNNLPNLSNIINQLTPNSNKKETKIYRNEKRDLSIKFMNSKTQEEKLLFNKNKNNYKEEKSAKETVILKSTNNIFKKNVETKESDKKKEVIDASKNEKKIISPKAINNNEIIVKEKINESLNKNIRLNYSNKIPKERKKKMIFDTEVKDTNNYVDKKINTEYKNRNIKQINSNNNSFRKKGIDYYGNSINVNTIQNMNKPYKTMNKNYQNILIQTTKMDNSKEENTSQLQKNEIITDKNLSNTNYVNCYTDNSSKKSNAIECNVVNLNLLNFPDNKKGIIKVNSDRQYSFDLKNKNRKNLLKSKDVNNQLIKLTNPYFSKTQSGFYNIKDTKDTGQLPINTKFFI